MPTARAFRGFRCPAEVLLWAVRWSLPFPISYRGLEQRLADRGVAVDHTTLSRWVQRFAPELETRIRRHLRPCRGPWPVDETDIRVDGQWRYSTERSTARASRSAFCSAPRRTRKPPGAPFGVRSIARARVIRGWSCPPGSPATRARCGP